MNIFLSLHKFPNAYSGAKILNLIMAVAGMCERWCSATDCLYIVQACLLSLLFSFPWYTDYLH